MQYEIRAMSFAEILDTALRLVTNHFVLFVGLFAVMNVPMALVTDYLTPVLPQPGDEVAPDEAIDLVNSGIALLLSTVVMLSILYPVAIAATTNAIAEQYRGRDVSFGGALRYALENLVRVTGTWVLVTLILMLGFLLLVLPGIYLALSFALVWPVMIIDRLYGMQAIRRSRELMRGNFSRALGIFVVSALIGVVLGSGAQLVLGQVPVVGILATPLVQSVSAAYATAAQIVLYFDIRCRKEGFDIEHLASLVERQEGTVSLSA
jgi:hypothetical protein